MADLFSAAEKTHEPLASRMRPRTLDEYIGQDHIVGKGRLLRRAIQADQLTSVIFYGPPGSGKTTLARVIANHTSSNFITLNAVLTGVADIRRSISDAENQRNLYNKKTILFVDEVHRWNKSQQDALLPWVENGTIILIGATTENPFFEVNKALVSRSRVFQLKPLTKEDLLKTARQALEDTQRGYGHWKVDFEDGALEHLVETANGDARSLLNALELAVETTPERWEPDASPPVPAWGSTIYISREAAEESIQKKVVLYDRDGDYHYDIISAFIKSLRGRDPDAACYWLARMVKAGEYPDFIFRRMLISACEDTGLADPYAIQVVQSCASAFDRVGMPEGRYFLAHAALYLATAPKSNSSMAFFDALSSVEKEDADVPNHLRDASRDAEGFGHGSGYLYPHAYRDHWVAQQYLPDVLTGRVFYTPSTQGYEAKIRDEVLSRRELQIAALLEENNEAPESGQVNPIGTWWQKVGHFNGFVKTEENLTFSPQDKSKDAALNRAEKNWRNRLELNRAETLLQIRDVMVSCAGLRRHHRSLVWNADDALLIFDILRKTPEGLTCGVCRTQKGMDIMSQYASTLNDIDKPLFTLSPQKNVFADRAFLKAAESFSPAVFDRVFFKDIFSCEKEIKDAALMLKEAFTGSPRAGRNFAFEEEARANGAEEPILSEDAAVIFSQRIPRNGQKISSLLHGSELDARLLDSFSVAEKKFFSNKDNPLFAWDSSTVQEIFSQEGFRADVQKTMLTENRRLTPQEIDRWFDADNSSYAGSMQDAVGAEGIARIAEVLKSLAEKTLFAWHTENIFVTVTAPNQKQKTAP
ncbi:MAG: AAA family ATPase [Treponema sp.]|nr:AAA family ATPase [Treponema sp.]